MAPGANAMRRAVLGRGGLELHDLTPEEHEQAYYAAHTGSPSGDAANKTTA